MKYSLWLLTLLFTACQTSEKADWLIVNAHIYTVDSNFSTASAMAIKDGRIVAVGQSNELIARFQADSVWDAEEQYIYPGFFDAHCHFSYYGLGLQQVDLNGTQSWEEVLHRIDSFAERNPQGWLIGRGWDQNDWPNKQLPDRADLDQRFPDRPVYLNRVDGHAVLVNGKALELAQIAANQAVEGGLVVSKNDRATGVLIDNAVLLIDKFLPAVDENRWKSAMLAAQNQCLAVGLTTVAEAGLDCLQITLLQALEAEGKLKIGIYPMITPSEANRKHYLTTGPQQSDRVHVRSFKFYADGALGSRGALLHQAYHDHPGQKGLLVTPAEVLESQAKTLLKAGFQVNTHCIGDAANSLVLDIYQKVLGDKKDHRWRIEHAQIVQPTDQNRFAELAVIPSIQPTHATSDMYWAAGRLGPSRIQYAYPYQSLLEKCGYLALGTDFPVEGISPLRTFYAAVFRQDVAGWPEAGFLPEQRLSRADALRGMTIWAAYAQFEEKDKGSLEVGKKADFVLLNTDLMTAERTDILKSRVERTVINGQQVYKR